MATTPARLMTWRPGSSRATGRLPSDVNDTRSTTSDKGDNGNRDDSEDACASVTGDDTASYEAATRREAEAARREAEAARGREAAAAQQVGRCELQQPDGKE